MHRQRRFAAGAAAVFARPAAAFGVAPEQVEQRKICLEPFDVMGTEAIAGIVAVPVGTRAGAIQRAFGKRRDIIFAMLIDAGVARQPMAGVERHDFASPFFAGGEHLHDRRVGDELYRRRRRRWY